MQNLIIEIELATKRAAKEGSKEAAKEVVREILSEMRNNRKNPISNVKKLLWMYRDLRLYVADEERYVEAFMDDNKPRKSKDIIIWRPGSKSSSDQETYGDYIDRAQIALAESRLLINKIELALDHVVEDEAYAIIECKYLIENKYSNTQIMIDLNISEATLKRREARILNRLSTLLFGASALDLGV